MPGSPTSRADPSTPRGLPPMLNQLSAPSPAPAPAFHLPHHAPPVDLAAATAALDEESPGSFSMEFDWGYTTELADKVGLDLQGGTPIWLHGSEYVPARLYLQQGWTAHSTFLSFCVASDRVSFLRLAWRSVCLSRARPALVADLFFCIAQNFFLRTLSLLSISISTS